MNSLGAPDHDYGEFRAIPFEIHREDDLSWFHYCMGGCGKELAHAKRVGVPMDDGSVRWIDQRRPRMGRRCADCGPFSVRDPEDQP